MDEDWKGELYCGITLKCNYKEGYVGISMPNYIHKKLIEYEHEPSKRPQNCPYAPPPVQYGKDSQLVTLEKNRHQLQKKDKKYVQKVLGSFLYYACAIDMTILHALPAIASGQAKPTKRTLERVHQLLDYMVTNPNAIVRFYASDMILNMHSDASYLSAGQGSSIAGGYFFLGSLPRDDKAIQLNGNIHITCTILKLVAASAAKAELGAIFLNT